MDAMHKGLDVSIYAKPELFPAPREVDRFLYIAKNVLKDSYTGFRPLARWIGSYTHILWLDLTTNTRYNLFGN